MSTFDDRTLIEDLVAHGVDDWVYEALVFGNIARRVASDPTDRRAIAIGLISEALLAGLMEAGETVPGTGFVPWRLDPEQAVVRIAREWTKRDDPGVGPGEIVWLRNTDRGDTLGNNVLEREKE